MHLPYIYWKLWLKTYMKTESTSFSHAWTRAWWKRLSDRTYVNLSGTMVSMRQNLTPVMTVQLKYSLKPILSNGERQCPWHTYPWHKNTPTKPCSNHSIPIINQIRSLASSPLFIYYKRTCILSLLISRIFQSKQTIEHIEQNAIKQNFHGNVRTCSFAKILHERWDVSKNLCFSSLPDTLPS